MIYMLFSSVIIFPKCDDLLLATPESLLVGGLRFGRLYTLSSHDTGFAALAARAPAALDPAFGSDMPEACRSFALSRFLSGTTSMI